MTCRGRERERDSAFTNQLPRSGVRALQARGGVDDILDGLRKIMVLKKKKRLAEEKEERKEVLVIESDNNKNTQAVGSAPGVDSLHT